MKPSLVPFCLLLRLFLLGPLDGLHIQSFNMKIFGKTVPNRLVCAKHLTCQRHVPSYSGIAKISGVYTPVVMRIMRFTYASSIRRAVVAGGSYKTTCMYQNKHEVEAGASQLAVA